MNTKTNLLKQILANSGGDPNALPDNMLSTNYEAIIVALGGNVEALPDRLETTYLRKIAELMKGGSSGDEYDRGYQKGYEDGELAGQEDGKEFGYTIGYDQGRQAEYDEFWDAFQQNGARRKYVFVFRNPATVWTPANFKPKYDIICEGDATQCFYAWEERNNSINLGAVLKSQGITLDTSKATNMNQFFAYGYSFIGEIPTISFASAGANTSGVFRGVDVTKIEKVIVTEQTIYTEWFLFCVNLVEIRFEGAISNDISFAYSHSLSKASIQDIMQHLSETTTGKTATISITAVNKAFATSAGANNGSTSEEWLALVNSRPNWTISLLDL